MIEISLQNTPNQSLSFDIGGYTYDVTLRTSDFLIADVYVNSSLVISGIRVLAYRPIIPFQYLTAGSGNLFFITDDGAYPDYSLFGVSQTLVYVDATEMEFLNVY